MRWLFGEFWPFPPFFYWCDIPKYIKTGRLKAQTVPGLWRSKVRKELPEFVRSILNHWPSPLNLCAQVIFGFQVQLVPTRELLELRSDWCLHLECQRRTSEMADVLPHIWRADGGRTMETSEPTGGGPQKKFRGFSKWLDNTDKHTFSAPGLFNLLLLVCFSFKMFSTFAYSVNSIYFFLYRLVLSWWPFLSIGRKSKKNISSLCEVTKVDVCTIHTELLGKEISLIHLANIK